MLTADDVRILDLNSAFLGVPTGQLMENAGSAVADVARRRFRARRVLVLAGLGNNGGDGLVTARHLAKEARVDVLIAGQPEQLKTSDARNALQLLDRRRIRLEPYRSPRRFRELARDADLVVDALLGIGVKGPLQEPVRTLVKLANQSRKPVLSIDVATGLGGPLQVRPRLTVTLHGRKRGMTPTNSGSIVVRPIGIPPKAETHVGPGDFAVPYPRNRAGSHKGENGRLLIVSGGPYCGAPLLAASAALRAGPDIVRLYTPGECARAAQASHPDLIVHPGVEERRVTPDDLARIEPILAKVDAVLIGPGLGLEPVVRRVTRGLIERVCRRRIPLVLDADAHAVAGEDPSILRRRPILVTPHQGEFRDLTGKRVPEDGEARVGTVQREAKRLGVTILLKGPVDVISDGRTTKRNEVHHPWMTVGGTGDVLAGVSAGLLAKKLDPFRAACAGSFLVGEAGRKTFERRSWSSRATDLVQELPNVFRDWLPVDRLTTPIRQGNYRRV